MSVSPFSGYCPAPHSTFYGLAINFGRLQGDILGEIAPVSRLGRQVNGVAKGYAQSWNLHRVHPTPPQSAARSHHTPPIKSTAVPTADFGRSQGDILGEVAPASRLGRQVNGVTKRYAQSWNLHRLHPGPLLLVHTSMTIHLPYGPYRGVKADVHSRPQGARLTPCGWWNVPPSPLPCHCSVRGLQESPTVTTPNFFKPP